MNKLEQITLLNKEWGSEVIWGHTDKYVVKTIEMRPNKTTPFFIHTKRDKNFIVVDGELYFMYGECCKEDPIKTYKLPVGWSWYIEPRMLYKYMTIDKPARIIEVSSYEEDVDEIVIEDEDMDPIKNRNRLKGKK